MKASIIIPSYNACERLYFNLLSLNMLEYNRDDFEVIVVDNDSTDGTSKMLLNITINYKLNIIHLKKNMGRAFARNYGVKEAKGELIIFLDSDMIVEKSFLIKHIEAHKTSNIAVCGQSWSRIYSFYYEGFKGYLERNLRKQLALKVTSKFNRFVNGQALITEYEIKNGKCFEYAFNLAKMHEAEFAVVNKYGENLEGFYFPWSMFVTNNCSIEKELFNQAGGFDNSFVNWGCEDLDLGYRLYYNGCKFVKCNHIKSMHQEHPVNFLDNGTDNILYFTRKYDSIDLLLFYYGYLIKVDKNIANEIMKEISEIKMIKQNDVLETYRRLLVALRNKNFRNCDLENLWFLEIKNLKHDVILHKQELQNSLNNIKYNRSTPNFLLTFELLIMKVFNKRLESLNQ